MKVNKMVLDLSKKQINFDYTQNYLKRNKK